MSPLDIRHDEAARRFEVRVDGYLCELEYHLSDQVISIDHTRVPPEIGGRGIAGQLVQAAFGLARARGWKVRPTCSYAASWARRHPDVSDLLI